MTFFRSLPPACLAAALGSWFSHSPPLVLEKPLLFWLCPDALRLEVRTFPDGA